MSNKQREALQQIIELAQYIQHNTETGSLADACLSIMTKAEAAIASREPMTQKQISESVEDQDELRSFIRGINVAERLHGIGD